MLVFRTGVGRLIYKSRNFQTGLTVTAYLWSPTLQQSAQQFLTEIAEGLYYLDFDFNTPGVWAVIFYENGQKSSFATVRVETGLASQETLQFLADIEGGRWLIKDNQMIFYKSDNVTEVARFDLFNSAGLPSEDDVVERVRVAG